MDLWQRAGELDDGRATDRPPLALIVSFIALCAGMLLVTTVAPALSRALAWYCPLSAAPLVIAEAALFFAVAVAPVMVGGSLRRTIRRGGSANAHQVFVSAVMTAIFVAFFVLATRAAPVTTGAAFKAVVLFAITATAALLFEPVLGRWYLPSAAGVLGGGPLAGFLMVEVLAVRADALLGLSPFSELRGLLSGPGLERRSLFGGCVLLYGLVLAAGLLLPKRASSGADADAAPADA